MKELETRYLERLSDLFPTIAAASTEIINLQAILNLPKGTEHFISDLHGEYDSFSHVLRNGSGSIRRKIDEVFANTLSVKDKNDLARLIYYPKETIERVKKTETDINEWYRLNLYRLIEVSKRASSKYTRSKVRKALPKDFSYVIEELITERAEISDKESYYSAIIQTMIQIGRAEEFIIAISSLIQRLVIDHLHIVGDIYDRGPAPHLIMDRLLTYHSLDIQWGNHDVLWMGAAAGQWNCIANVIRICIRYGNLDILEDGYGINLLPLATFAMATYAEDPCDCFQLKDIGKEKDSEVELNQRMHKAISIIQFKLDGQVIKRQKDFQMEDRALLHRIDYEKGTIDLEGKTYGLKDTYFPTIDPENPYALTVEEQEVMERLEKEFSGCEKLQEHMNLLLSKGSLYKVYNGNLLYHGCVPLNEDGSLRQVNLFGENYRGKALFDVLDKYARKGFFSRDPLEKEQGKDIMWYIWSSPNSPLFGKDKMTTFERYFLEEEETHKEEKNPYYRYLDDENEDVVDKILEEFGLPSEDSFIINGHVPVKSKDGESPVKCHGKVVIIDGGFSKAYQKETGIAGYTLIYNSWGIRLVPHEPFESREAAIEKDSDAYVETIPVCRMEKRKLVGDTDTGRELKEQIADLETLLEAYRSGEIKEKL